MAARKSAKKSATKKRAKTRATDNEAAQTSARRASTSVQAVTMTTADDVRRLALGLPGARESSHFGGVPDFRVGPKIFATLEKHGQRGGLYNLSDARKAELVRDDARAFSIRGAALYVEL